MAQVEPIEVVLRLESSSKWPDELEAVRSTGTAFLIRLAQCLERKVRSEDIFCVVVVTEYGWYFGATSLRMHDLALDSSLADVVC